MINLTVLIKEMIEYAEYEYPGVVGHVRCHYASNLCYCSVRNHAVLSHVIVYHFNFLVSQRLTEANVHWRPVSQR